MSETSGSQKPSRKPNPSKSSRRLTRWCLGALLVLLALPLAAGVAAAATVTLGRNGAYDGLDEFNKSGSSSGWGDANWAHSQDHNTNKIFAYSYASNQWFNNGGASNAESWGGPSLTITAQCPGQTLSQLASVYWDGGVDAYMDNGFTGSFTGNYNSFETWMRESSTASSWTGSYPSTTAQWMDNFQYSRSGNTFDLDLWYSAGTTYKPQIGVRIATNADDAGNQISVNAKDFVNGRSQGLRTGNVHVDWMGTNAPFFDPPTNGGVWKNAPFSVVLTAHDPTACVDKVEYRTSTNGGAWSGWTADQSGLNKDVSVSVPINVDGTTTIEYKACNFQSPTQCSPTQTTTGKLDRVAPTASITGPVAGWRNFDFSASFSASDTLSGLSSCDYRVLSNGLQTVGWTGVSCTGSAPISVWSSGACRDQGPDRCKVEFKAKDLAGNEAPTPTSRLWSIDWSLPSSSVTGPTVPAWQRIGFTATVIDSDNIGCTGAEYRILRAGSQVRSGTRACQAGVSVSVGAVSDCSVQGLDMCRVEARASDAALNWGPWSGRDFDIDYSSATSSITGPSAAAWYNAGGIPTTVTDDDPGLSGETNCQDRITANGVLRQDWSARGCDSGRFLSVGAAGLCNAEGAAKCLYETRANDNAANPVSAVSSRSFNVDFTNPSTTITGPAASSWQRTNFVVTATDSDNIGCSSARYEIYNQGSFAGSGSRACGGSVTVQVPSQCSVAGLDRCSVKLFSKDAANNEHAGVSRAFSIDYSGPSSTIAGPSGDAWKRVAFNVDVDDVDDASGVSTCSFRIVSGGTQTSSGTRTCNGEFSVSVGAAAACRTLGVDQCIVFVSSRDVAGTNGPESSVAYDIDFSVPSTTIDGPPAGTFFASNFDVAISDNDGPSGVSVCEYRVQSNGVTTQDWTQRSCASGVNIPVGPGQLCRDQGSSKCTVAARSRDAAGNQGPETSRGFGVDWSAPSTTHSLVGTAGNNGWHTSNVQVTLNCVDNPTVGGNSGCDVTSYAVDGAWNTYAGTFTISDEGFHNVEYYSTDRLGTQESSHSFAVNIDKSAPSSSIVSPSDGETVPATFTVTFQDSDAGPSGLQTCYYKVIGFLASGSTGDTGFQPRACNGSVTITASPLAAPGQCRTLAGLPDELPVTSQCRIATQAEDAAGNRSPESSITVNIGE